MFLDSDSGSGAVGTCSVISIISKMCTPHVQRSHTQSHTAIVCDKSRSICITCSYTHTNTHDARPNIRALRCRDPHILFCVCDDSISPNGRSRNDNVEHCEKSNIRIQGILIWHSQTP